MFLMVVHRRSIPLLAYPAAMYKISLSLLVYPVVVYTGSIQHTQRLCPGIPNYTIPKAVNSVPNGCAPKINTIASVPSGHVQKIFITAGVPSGCVQDL